MTLPSEKKQQPQVQPTGLACTQTYTIFTPDLRLPLQLLLGPPLLLLCHRQSLRRLQVTPGLASIATPEMMGAVAGPLVAAGFVTPVTRAMGPPSHPLPSPLHMERTVSLPFPVKGGSPLSLDHL